MATKSKFYGSLAAARVRLANGSTGTVARDFRNDTFEVLVRGTSHVVPVGEIAECGDDVASRAAGYCEANNIAIVPMRSLCK